MVAGASEPEHRREHGGARESTDAHVAFSGFSEQFMQSLGGLGLLDGLDGIHIGDIQEALNRLTQFSPFLAVGDEKDVDVSRTEQFGADVIFRAIRVDRTAPVEKSVGMSATSVHIHPLRLRATNSLLRGLVIVQDHHVLRTQFESHDSSVLLTPFMKPFAFALGPRQTSFRGSTHLRNVFARGIW